MHSLSKTTPIYAMLMISLLFAAPLSAQDKVRVGLSSVSATNGSIWVAEDKGLFRKHGIDVEVIVVGGGGARVVSSLVAGDLTSQSVAAKDLSVRRSGEPTRSSQPPR
ncbi:MAG TPA: hypothetical protein VEO92_06685 [Candidatus Nitrosocosmicus sp.]|nr:hypothetical protein [Candidatus Nitrosocosmicus sp.]